MNRMEQRLQKILSAAGVASRRTAEVLIEQGRVGVNGRTVTELGSKADPDRDDIRVDGRRIKTGHAVAARYLLLNKPVGVVTTRSDPQRRRTVMDLLRGEGSGLYPVGRLDYDSEGLLLLTNDGDLAARLTHPRHEVAKTYHAVVLGAPDAHDLERLMRGLRIESRGGRRSARPPEPEGRRRVGASDHRTAPTEVRVVKAYADPRGRDRALVEITLREGRNRQVRRMFDAIGHPVESLRRVRIGPLKDATLKPGEWRALTVREIAALKRATAAGG